MNLSNFGTKFTKNSGILQLMDDLGSALGSDRPVNMLGGGNPAHIPDVEKHFRSEMQHILDNNTSFEKMLGDYDSPQGNVVFINALVTFFNNEYGWGITRDNIALTNGSQTAFFMLFNMLAGTMPDGSKKKILLPLAPEYIGYTDVGLSDDFFISFRPKIEELGNNQFKYRVDFETLTVTENIAAICVSRPTNPTGNVITDEELEKLSALSKQHNIPLIVDNAYGTPFPNIIFTEAKPHWEPHMIYCMSLSKIGLPGTRTGIIIARPDIVKAVSGVSAIMSLAPTSIGATLMERLVRTGEIKGIAETLIKPFYERRMKKAVAWVDQYFGETPHKIHKPEGSLFLWLWFPDLPITTIELYERLKKRDTIVVPGEYYFPGLEQDTWKHKSECIRITYAQSEEVVEKGIAVIADEVRQAYNK